MLGCDALLARAERTNYFSHLGWNTVSNALGPSEFSDLVQVLCNIQLSEYPSSRLPPKAEGIA